MDQIFFFDQHGILNEMVKNEKKMLSYLAANTTTNIKEIIYF